MILDGFNLKPSDCVTKSSQSIALAILRAGRSYAEAAEVSGLPVEQVMALWRDTDGGTNV